MGACRRYIGGKLPAEIESQYREVLCNKNARTLSPFQREKRQQLFYYGLNGLCSCRAKVMVDYQIWEAGWNIPQLPRSLFDQGVPVRNAFKAPNTQTKH